MELVGVQPRFVGAQHLRQIEELVAQPAARPRSLREFLQSVGTDLMFLQLTQHAAELLGESGQAGRRVKHAQLSAQPGQQRAQHHHAALGAQQLAWGGARQGQDHFRQPVEGENPQPGVTCERGIREQLPFELERGLFRRQQHQRQTFRVGEECVPNLAQTAEGLAAAGGAQNETRMHGLVLLRNSSSGKPGDTAAGFLRLARYGATTPTPAPRQELQASDNPVAGPSPDRHVRRMAWFYLVIAGLMEIGWPLGLKLSQAPERREGGILLAVGCMALSGFFLWLAQRHIPMGTAYAVWTGIGTIGTFAVGIAVFGEPRDALRLVSVLLIVIGILGLRLAHRPA